jgi:Flp pilus assembly protein CpaB
LNFLKNYKAWLALMLLFAAGAGFLSVHLIRSYTGTVEVVSALTDLDAGSVIRAQSTAMVDCARGNLYPDAVSDPGEVAGMVARGFIPGGTILRKSMFVSPRMSGVSGQLTSLGRDYRAVAVANTTATTVAGVVRPGDRVSIYVSPKEAPAHVKLLDDVLVVQAGAVETGEGQQQTSGLVLALGEKDAETLIDYLPGGRKEAPLIFFLKPVEEG